MLLEAKWTADPLPASAVYQFKGKVDGKLVGTVGLFVSMGGYSADAIDALIAGKTVNVLLADAADIRAVVSGELTMLDLLDHKVRAAAETGTPYQPLSDRIVPAPGISIAKRARTVLVEGQFDAHVVRAVVEEFGPSEFDLVVIPAGGPRNFPLLASGLLAQGVTAIVVLAESDRDPESTRDRLQREFAEAGILIPNQDEVEICVLNSDLEIALGLFPPGEFTTGRRKVLALSNELLRRKLREADVPRRAEEDPSLKAALQVLGLPISQGSA
jgi:hypothetical protein